MAPGRTVPWCCWEEWYLVRDWLLSQSHNDIRLGIQKVEAWRARGRMPLGVDITASLLETALCDASFWGAAAATVLPRNAAVAASFVSQQQIRLQYSATIVRMVNGIADSQQKGRVALSVNSLAEAAGLSRLLVDVRHEATHNELPSLSTLQLAAKQALDWLLSQYWQRQADHLQACHLRVQGILAAIFQSCKAAAAKNAAAAAADEDDATLTATDDQERAAASGAYKASEGRKQRKLLLAELKGLVPPSHAPLLAALLLQSDVMKPPPQQEQQAQQEQVQCESSTAHNTALTALSKQYPDLRMLLLEEVVSALAELPAQQQQQRGSQQQQQQQQQQHGACNADTLVAWLQLLLPAESAAAVHPSLAGKIGSKGRSHTQQQQHQQGGSHAEQLGGGASSAGFLSRLLAKMVKARQEVVGAASAASHQAVGVGARSAEQREGSAAEAGTAAGITHRLLEAQQLLSAALARSSKQATGAGGSSSSSKINNVVLQQLAGLAVPKGISDSTNSASDLGVVTATAAVPCTSSHSKQQQGSVEQKQPQMQQQQQDESWQQHQQELLQQAVDKQQQLITQQQQQRQPRKRKTVEAGTAAAAAADTGEPRRKRWQRMASWSPCAIGCLPNILRPRDLLALLHNSVSVSDECRQNATDLAAAAAEQQVGQQPGGNADVAGVLKPSELALLETEQAVLCDAAEAACVGSQHQQQAAAIAADDVVGGGDDTGTLRFGQHWQISRQNLGQFQQAVRFLL